MLNSSQGEKAYELIERLYPICRSITGDGVRETLQIIAEHIDLQRHEVPSGEKIFDWTIPNEWNINDAWIKNPAGDKVVDFTHHNLHVVSYSEPVNKTLSRQQLDAHLYSLPEHPSWIPYRTSYFNKSWGFCLSDEVRRALPDGDYEVFIDATLQPGHLSYGEFFIPGELQQEIVITTHICHPSMCNDNLSGIAVAVFLARALLHSPVKFGMRFIFAPATIGAITWLYRNQDSLKRIAHGLVLSNLGDASPFTYKKTFSGRADLDGCVESVLSDSNKPYRVIDFSPWGYDERQFSSPGFRLPFGCLMRGQNSAYPEYHSSADNLDFVSAENLSESLGVIENIVNTLQTNTYYRNTSPFGEPQLGKRGIYRSLGGEDVEQLQLAMLWLLNQSDGEHSLTYICQRSGIEMTKVMMAAKVLEAHELLTMESTPFKL